VTMKLSSFSVHCRQPWHPISSLEQARKKTPKFWKTPKCNNYYCFWASLASFPSFFLLLQLNWFWICSSQESDGWRNYFAHQITKVLLWCFLRRILAIFAKAILEKEFCHKFLVFFGKKNRQKRGEKIARNHHNCLYDGRFLLAGRISVVGPKFRWCHVVTSWLVEVATGIATRCEEVEWATWQTSHRNRPPCGITQHKVGKEGR